VIPFSAVIVPAFIIYRKSIEHVYENNPALYILAFGMAAAKVTNKLVVSLFFIIFQVPTAVSINISAYCVVVQYTLLDGWHCFRVTCCRLVP
jgi:hypothetical protein